VTTELQQAVMKSRMQPIGSVWSKFPRMVRDLASICGKQVRIEMEGKEIDLDRTIIEAIKDPLTHIIRNAVDHGIESPADRLAQGKRVEGTIRLRAFHEDGRIDVEISDDGAGIAPERVRQRALAHGLITGEHSQWLSDHDVIKLIFRPGFSTAEKVTNVSGRGVGMDVVKTNVEKIGGTVDLQSVSGRGTTLRIKIPLTLAIIPALMSRRATSTSLSRS
jgi:two-component system chemotaxis sensor kinase CheA